MLQAKEQEKPPEKELNKIREMEATSISDEDFKIMVTRMHKELSENTKNFWEATGNLLWTTEA